MAVMSISAFESFFRLEASLNVDKADLDRYNDCITRKVNDLLIRGEATARANARDVIEPHDFPITRGLQESMQALERLDEDQDLGLQRVLEELTAERPIDLEVSAATEGALPRVAGGLSVALARTFKILHPKLRNPQSEQWERSFRVFNLLL